MLPWVRRRHTHLSNSSPADYNPIQMLSRGIELSFLQLNKDQTKIIDFGAEEELQQLH